MIKKLALAILAFLTFSSLAGAQVTCGPYAPIPHAAASETIVAYAICQYPDPASWSHIYTFQFPSTLTYNGTVLNFSGNASAKVYGQDYCAPSSGHAGQPCRNIRLVTVDSASLTDPNGVAQPILKTKQGTQAYPVDAWLSTSPLAPDTLYSFSVAGTANTSPLYDELRIQADYTIGN